MKFTISKSAKPETVKKSEVKKTPPVTEKVKAKLKEKPAKRRSDKEIALMWLVDQLSGVASRAKEMDAENMAGYADGRKIAEQHIRKMQEIVNKRVSAYRKPMDTLLEARGLA